MYLNNLEFRLNLLKFSIPFARRCKSLYNNAVDYAMCIEYLKPQCANKRVKLVPALQRVTRH